VKLRLSFFSLQQTHEGWIGVVVAFGQRGKRATVPMLRRIHRPHFLSDDLEDTSFQKNLRLPLIQEDSGLRAGLATTKLHDKLRDGPPWHRRC
jgi:hypothetical protein